MTSNDDMVITPQLAGSDRGAASTNIEGDSAARPTVHIKDPFFRRAVASRGIVKARAARRARLAAGSRGFRGAGAGRLIARAGGPAAVAAVAAAIIAKRITGMTFEQMAQKGEDVFFGEAAMKARAVGRASATMMGNRLSMIALHNESRRAEATGTTNRALEDLAVVHGFLTIRNMRDERGRKRFLAGEDFRVESIADILAENAADWLAPLIEAFRDFSGKR